MTDPNHAWDSGFAPAEEVAEVEVAAVEEPAAPSAAVVAAESGGSGYLEYRHLLEIITH